MSTRRPCLQDVALRQLEDPFVLLVMFVFYLHSYKLLTTFQAGYVPKDAYEITPLVKTVGICTDDGIVILDPTKCVTSSRLVE